MAHAQTKSDAVGEIEWVVSVDASVAANYRAAVVIVSLILWLP